jgi:hypothetical protein
MKLGGRGEENGSEIGGDCMQGGLGGARRPSGSARLRFTVVENCDAQ